MSGAQRFAGFRIRYLPLLSFLTIIAIASVILVGCGKKRPKPAPTPAATPFVLQQRPTSTPTPIPNPAPAEPTPPPRPTPSVLVAPTPTPLWGSSSRPLPGNAPTPVPEKRTKSIYVFDPSPTDYRVSIPAIGVNAAVAAVGLEEDGAIAEPPNGDVFGWFSPGAKPGENGNVLLDCHLDYNDPRTGPRKAVCWRLAELPVGGKVVLEDISKRYTYEVEETNRWDWDDPEAVALLKPATRAIVTIITCEGVGQFDAATRNYPYRRTVVAKLIATEPR